MKAAYEKRAFLLSYSQCLPLAQREFAFVFHFCVNLDPSMGKQP